MSQSSGVAALSRSLAWLPKGALDWLKVWAGDHLVVPVGMSQATHLQTLLEGSAAIEPAGGMHRTRLLLTTLLAVTTVVAAGGCGFNSGSPTCKAVDSFFDDDHVMTILEEYNGVISDAHYVFTSSRLSRDACNLLERVNKNREEVVDKDCPEELLTFWTSIFMSSVRATWALQEMCAQGLMREALDQWALALEGREQAHSALEALLAECD